MVAVTRGQYREWLEAQEKEKLIELVMESRELAEFLRGQLQGEARRANDLAAAGDAVADSRARMGGIKRHLVSPQGKAKQMAFALWRERRAGKHPRLRTNEQFATEVMRRWPMLTSSKVVCGWCTDWEKEAKTSGTPAS